MTGELNLIRNNNLRKVLSFGPNFRDKADAVTLDAVENGLNNFIERFASGTFPVSSFDDWKFLVLNKCSTRLAALNLRKNGKPKALLDKRARIALKRLTKHLVIVPIDKASNNLALVCKSLYSEILKSELQSNAYEPCDETEDEIISRHGKYLEKLHMMGEEFLPFLYMMPKFHKEPISYRFIAASKRCTTSKLSSILSDILTFIIRSLRKKDDDNIRTSGIRRYFITETFEEVTTFLTQWKRSKKARGGLYTGDFSTMYTSIPHNELFEGIESSVREAFEWISAQNGWNTGKVGVKWAGDSCKWVRCRGNSHSKCGHTVTSDRLIELVKFLVSNTFVHNKIINRQTIGIPMGTNCAPPLANLFLYHYESSFISRLEIEEGVEAAKKFHMTFRLIDDVLSVDNPTIQKALDKPFEMGGLYPASLELKKTSKSNDSVDFIGVNIKKLKTRFRLSVYDKRKSFPFKVHRYPLMCSLIPKTIPYGVFVGQLHRGYRICSDVEDFLSFAVELALTLLRNGCSYKRLNNLFKCFVHTHVEKFPNIGKIWVMKVFRKELGSKRVETF
jgi:hypothetical protein